MIYIMGLLSPGLEFSAGTNTELMFRFERAPVTEREKWWQQMPVKRHHTYR
jgi:hypothetical protein